MTSETKVAMSSSALQSPSQPHQIHVIGVIGGIGSGKSAVARWVAERANVSVVDADQLGHQVLLLNDVKLALRQRFGTGIFDERGEVSRGLLAKQVFGHDDVQQRARHDLEQIVHPAIKQLMIDAIAQSLVEGREAVLLDAAVLLEAGWKDQCNAVVFVDAPDDVRQRRVAARSGWSLEELRRRESSQLGLADKRRQSDIVILNAVDDGTAGQELLDFLLRNWGICCKPLSNSSQQS